MIWENKGGGVLVKCLCSDLTDAKNGTCMRFSAATTRVRVTVLDQFNDLYPVYSLCIKL